MLVNKEIFDNIDQIIEQAYTGFLFNIIGDDFLTEEQKAQLLGLGIILDERPLIEILYIMIRQRAEERYKKDANLNKLIDELKGSAILPIVNDYQQATLDIGKTQFKEAIESSKNIAKKQIKNYIINFNNEEKQRQTIQDFTNIPSEVSKRSSSINSLTAIIGAALVASHKNFITELTNSMTDFINNGVVDQAYAQSEDPKDVIVFKKTQGDSKVCSYCRKFYVNEDGTPKEYKLSDLQKNGTNYGKPKSNWKPTISKVHPRCRCELHIKSPKEK